MYLRFDLFFPGRVKYVFESTKPKAAQHPDLSEQVALAVGGEFMYLCVDELVNII